MISGIGVAAYSVYSGQSESISGSAQVSDVKNNQKPIGAEIEKEEEYIEDTATISDEAKQLLAKEKSDESEKLPAEKLADTRDKKALEKEQLPAEKRVETPEDREEASEKILAEKKLESNDDKVDEAKSEKKLKTEGDLSQAEMQEVQQLKARDAEVKAHEQAHIAAAVGLTASAPSYDYQTGPDGKKYAVGGEVNISFMSGNNPEEDIRNAETMRNAALAPSEPSGQDRSVAKSAEKIIQEAKEKLAEQQEQQKEQLTKTESLKTLIGAGGLIQG